jgi:hypothetical protein
MSTTIQVEDDCSADESLQKKAKRMDRSHFGSLPKLESFRREEVDRFD